MALPLYAAAALVLAVRLVVRRRWRTPTTAVLVLALAGLGVHAWWFAPQVSGANPPAAAGAEPLVVMTANVAQGDGDVDRAGPAGQRGGRRPAGRAGDHRGRPRRHGPRRPGRPVRRTRAGEPGLRQRRRHGVRPHRARRGRAHRHRHDGWIVSVGRPDVVATHPQAPTLPELWRSDHAALLDAVRANDRRPRRRRLQRDRRPRADAGARGRGLPRRGGAGEPGLAADLAVERPGRRRSASRCRAWPRSTTSWSGRGWPPSACTPGRSPAATTGRWSPRSRRSSGGRRGT